jgi:DnaJ-class molecular chaperone
MAKTITCKHCQGTVAKNADKCPHCGGRTPTRLIQDVIGLVGFFVILFIIVGIFTGDIFKV